MQGGCELRDSDRAIRSVSDTAIWAALYRAVETDRADALFRDPFARLLAGGRGVRIAAEMRSYDRHAWGWVVRTYLFDQWIEEQIRLGSGLVVNLAAGLDARPYRMQLPAELSWIEVDLPQLVAYKEDILRNAQPRCQLERTGLDLSNADTRRQLFARLGAANRNALAITEGLLIYLTPEQVIDLATDLAAAGFRHWIFDLPSPGLLRMFNKRVGVRLNEANAPLQFAPSDGPAFVARAGWQPVNVASIVQTAGKLRRDPLFLRLLALLPEAVRPAWFPWLGVCLARRSA